MQSPVCESRDQWAWSGVVSSPRTYRAIKSQLSLTCHWTFLYYEFTYFPVPWNISLKQRMQICRLRVLLNHSEFIAVLSSAVPESDVANLSHLPGQVLSWAQLKHTRAFISWCLKGAKWNKLIFHSFVTKISFHQLQQENWKKEVTELSEESWWLQALLTPQLSALPRPCSCFFWYPDITYHTGDMEYFSSEWIPSPSDKALSQISKPPCKSAASQWTQPSISYLLPTILLLLTLAFSSSKRIFTSPLFLCLKETA